MVLIVLACGLSAESIAQQQKANDLRQRPPPREWPKRLIGCRLRKARDEAYINNPNISAVRREDFTTQKRSRPIRAIKELQHGFSVSHDEIEEALLEVPSQHISPAYRAQLIQELQKAQQLDEKREQEILIYWKDD